MLDPNHLKTLSFGFVLFYESWRNLPKYIPLTKTLNSSDPTRTLLSLKESEILYLFFLRQQVLTQSTRLNYRSLGRVRVPGLKY